MALFPKYCEQSTPINVRLQVVSLKIAPGDWLLLAQAVAIKAYQALGEQEKAQAI